MASRRNLLVALALASVHAAGCYSPYMRWPDLYHPGSAGQQRAVAEKFDPYPSPDTGPEVIGGRPLGYQRPLTESEWGRRYASPGGILQSAPVPALPTTTVFTAPYPPSAAVAPTPMSPSQIQPRSPY